MPGTTKHKHKKTCKAPGCNNPHRSLGYCNTHYLQVWKHGEIRLTRAEKRRLKPDPPTKPSQFLLQGHIVKIELRRKGKENVYAIIDKNDLPTVIGYHWYPAKGGNTKTMYAKARVSMKSTRVSLHRVIIGDIPEGYEVDHANGNGLDNRRRNLRIATREQNARNIAHPTSNTSGYKGVSMDQRTKKWVAHIRYGNKKHYLGSFQTRKDAAIAYNQKAEEVHGDFAALNRL